MSHPRGWKSASERWAEVNAKIGSLKHNRLSWGIDFLDRATRGIFQDDLILFGAPSGFGKTQFCTNLALANIQNNKRVHFIALEASRNEIEQRMTYSLYAQMFYNDPYRPANIKLNYVDWLLGEYEQWFSRYKEDIAAFFLQLDNLFTYYKYNNFGATEMTENILTISKQTDLIIVDHVHYFDFEDDNENRALKQIAKTARTISQVIEKPILLVAHLRKRDRMNKELIAGIDEFHGSSDLTKIATKVITISRGDLIPGTRKSKTYVRFCKSRMDGSICHYVAELIYDLSTNSYTKSCTLGHLSKDLKKFEPTLSENIPSWMGKEINVFEQTTTKDNE